MCDGNVTSTAECFFDFNDIKLEIDSSLSDDEQLEMPPIPMQFVLSEAHSLLPEEFDGDLESDEESNAELDDPPIEEINENGKEIADANDEMEVTTTVQEFGYDMMHD